MEVLVLADTHIKRGSSRVLPPKVWSLVDRADVILHAGDIVIGEVLDDLAQRAPVYAVLGNNDHDLARVLPETIALELDGVLIGMIHDSGAARGRDRRMHQRFPDSDVVVFGHSHIPWNTVGSGGQVLFNPGSPTERRRQPHRTAGVLRLEDGRVMDRRIEIVDP